MSNKKLFWIAFFILSCCEFGQLAYSKNKSASSQALNSSGEVMRCQDDKNSSTCQVLDAKIASYTLPR